MAICCWRFEDPDLSSDINIAVKGAKRAAQLAAKLRAAFVGSRVVLPLDPLPEGPIRHYDGWAPYEGASIYTFSSLVIEVTAPPSPDLAVEETTVERVVERARELL